MCGSEGSVCCVQSEVVAVLVWSYGRMTEEEEEIYCAYEKTIQIVM